jgi:hypothetical protein
MEDREVTFSNKNVGKKEIALRRLVACLPDCKLTILEKYERGLNNA